MTQDDVNDGSAAADSADVRLYTLAGCGACWGARRLLRRRGIEFEEVRGDGTPRFRETLRRKTGRWTVPQVVIDGEPIGGADSLLALDRLGVLGARIRRERFPIAVVRRRRSLSGLFGGRSRRYRVLLVDRDGRTIERLDSASIDQARTLAEALG
jgi:glutaredoxin 3